MITSFSLRNFKSYEETVMRLSSLTLFIGANASGKSNALEAIRLLSWLSGGTRLDDMERRVQGTDYLVRGQAHNLFKDPRNSFQISCTMSSNTENWNTLELDIGLFNEHLIIVGESVTNDSQSNPLYQIDGAPKDHTDEISVAYNNFKKGGNKPHIPCSNRQAIFYQLETPGRFDKNNEKSQRVIPAVVKEIRTALRRIVFLDPRPMLMRDYSYAKDDEMKEDGSNLSSVLNSICNGTREDRERLLEFVRSLPEQDIKDIGFIRTDRDDVMVRLVESFGNKERSVDAPLLSDGTLRVLAVGATLLSAPKDALVIIEEIDNGVHPSRAEALIRQIRELSEKRNLRVLITSHNPALLDALPDASLGDVLCCYRDPRTGDSQIEQLKKLESFPELVAQGKLGQLMTKDILDRYLKKRISPLLRKKQAFKWLKAFEAEVSE